MTTRTVEEYQLAAGPAINFLSPFPPYRYLVPPFYHPHHPFVRVYNLADRKAPAVVGNYKRLLLYNIQCNFGINYFQQTKPSIFLWLD